MFKLSCLLDSYQIRGYVSGTGKPGSAEIPADPPLQWNVVRTDYVQAFKTAYKKQLVSFYDWYALLTVDIACFDSLELFTVKTWLSLAHITIFNLMIMN